MTARTIADLPLGAFTLIVGQDDEAIERHVCAVDSDSSPYQSERGVAEWQTTTACNLGEPLLLLSLFDSLHPTRIPAAMASLRAAGVPVVATTHNVYVLDCCNPGEVLVLHDGQVARLSEHPEAERMKGALSAGQLWTLDDEATWVPAAAERRGR